METHEGADIRPALTPEQWCSYLHNHWDWTEPRAMALVLIDQDDNYHGGAAIALHGQPFGFTREDVAAVQEELENAEHHGDPDAADRLALVVAKIKALLPPK